MADIKNPSLREKLAPHRRSAWIPEVVDGEGVPDGSRLGGAPWLRPGEAWPACGACGRPMQLFVQLNARDLPPTAAQALEGGLLQFFYCTSDDESCMVDAEPWAPFAPTAFLRLVARDDLGGGGTAASAPGMFPSKRIVSWTESRDYPDWEAVEDLGVTMTDEESAELSDEGFPLSGEKLLGWPLWVQGVEYPDCPDCGERMELLFQVDSEQNIPYMFGDAGVGHVTQCPRHRGRLAFGWACG
jgi:uncharacterized protein YwqG